MYESARGGGPREEDALRSWSERSERREGDRLSSLRESNSGFGGKGKPDMWVMMIAEAKVVFRSSHVRRSVSLGFV